MRDLGHINFPTLTVSPNPLNLLEPTPMARAVGASGDGGAHFPGVETPGYHGMRRWRWGIDITCRPMGNALRYGILFPSAQATHCPLNSTF